MEALGIIEELLRKKLKNDYLFITSDKQTQEIILNNFLKQTDIKKIEDTNLELRDIWTSH